MSRRTHPGDVTTDPELLSVSVDVWHPSCWTLDVSRETSVGLVGNGTTVHDDVATGRYTLCGPSGAALDDAVEAIRASTLTDRATVLPTSTATVTAGPAAREVLVEFDAAPSIRDAFTDRGFVHRGATRHEDGRERRSFFVRGDRTAVRDVLDDIERAYDADIDLRRLSPVDGGDGGGPSGETAAEGGTTLSPRQREAFELARDEGYYAYPRGATATDLADSLGVSKTTFLEHLRKAESKLLANVDLG